MERLFTGNDDLQKELKCGKHAIFKLFKLFKLSVDSAATSVRVKTFAVMATRQPNHIQMQLNTCRLHTSDCFYLNFLLLFY